MTDIEATKLFNENMKLVPFYLNKNNIIQSRNDYEDMIQTGYIGLWKACRTYKPELNIKFSTYALTCISNEFKQYYKNQSKSIVPSESIDDYDETSGVLYIDFKYEDPDSEDLITGGSICSDIMNKINSSDYMKVGDRLEVLSMMIDGKTEVEIATYYKCSRQAISAKVIGIKRRLKRFLKKYL